jgi:AraC family transcriptional regulator
MPIKTATLNDHAARISRAVRHLSERLERTPSLEELAGVAAFSPCHFHRVYRAMMGETPAETLTRLRLSRAAAALIRTEQPMTRIAREAGYGSVAAFTRAFREAHGLPPGAYRHRAGIGAVLEHDMTEVTFTELPALHLATLRHHGAYTEIGGTFERLSAWAGGSGLVGPETRFYGLYWDDPHTVPVDELRSRAAMTVPEGTPLGAGMEPLSLPPLRCARLRFQGPYSELETAYDRLYGEWLPASGEEPAEHPALEHYLNDCRTLPPAEWLTDILLPLKRR